MSLLSFQNIYKRFNTVEVLHGVSFEVEAGKVLGLIGENGSGKSTCMNILGGIVPMTGGSMAFHQKPYHPQRPRDARDVGIAFVHQELNLFSNLSIEENIFIDAFPRFFKWLPMIHRREVRQKARALLQRIGLHQTPTTSISQLSQGERQMVEIAKGLRSEAKLMIFDEPTTSLTKRECDRLFEIIEGLRDHGLGIIYISHILDDVMKLADHIVVLRDGRVTATCEATSTTKDDLVRHMVGREINQLYPTRSGRTNPPISGERTVSSPGTPKALMSSQRRFESEPRTLLRVSKLSKPGFVEDINLEISTGEIVGIAGLMGSGRTEFARMLFGLDTFTRGTIEVNNRMLRNHSPVASAGAGMAFVTEDRRKEGLFLDARIRPNISAASLTDYAHPTTGFIKRKQLDAAADETVNATGLGQEAPWGKLVRNLSGGNQQKVVLAKWMMRSPTVLILDEPTRGIDIGAKHAIYESIAKLADAGSAVLMISSEMEELMGMCDRIVVMQRGEISAEFTRSEFDNERLMHAAIWTREEVL